MIEKVKIQIGGLNFTADTIPDALILLASLEAPFMVKSDKVVLKKRKYTRKVAVNRFKPWTGEDEELVSKMRKEGETFKWIGKRIGRSTIAVNVRWSKFIKNKHE